MTVLVIDDEFDVLENIKDILELEGYATLTTLDGQDGIDLAISEKPDLILSDISLPYTNGFDVIKAVKSNPISKVSPFIFLTAKASFESKQQGMKLGADDYITKPFNNQYLVDTIKKRIEEYRERKCQN